MPVNLNCLLGEFVIATATYLLKGQRGWLSQSWAHFITRLVGRRRTISKKSTVWWRTRTWLLPVTIAARDGFITAAVEGLWLAFSAIASGCNLPFLTQKRTSTRFCWYYSPTTSADTIRISKRTGSITKTANCLPGNVHISCTHTTKRQWALWTAHTVGRVRNRLKSILSAFWTWLTPGYVANKRQLNHRSKHKRYASEPKQYSTWVLIQHLHPNIHRFYIRDSRKILKTKHVNRHD